MRSPPTPAATIPQVMCGCCGSTLLARSVPGSPPAWADLSPLPWIINQDGCGFRSTIQRRFQRRPRSVSQLEPARPRPPLLRGCRAPAGVAARVDCAVGSNSRARSSRSSLQWRSLREEVRQQDDQRGDIHQVRYYPRRGGRAKPPCQQPAGGSQRDGCRDSCDAACGPVRLDRRCRNPQLVFQHHRSAQKKHDVEADSQIRSRQKPECCSTVRNKANRHKRHHTEEQAPFSLHSSPRRLIKRSRTT